MKRIVPHPAHHRGFSVTEVLVGLALVLLVITLGSAVQGRLTRRSKAAGCTQNLRQVGVLLGAYLADHRMIYPYSNYRDSPQEDYRFWASYLIRHAGDSSNLASFICPGVKEVNPALRRLTGGTAYVSYGISRYGVSPSVNDTRLPAHHLAIEEPSRLMVMMDYDESNQPYEGWYSSSYGGLKAHWGVLLGRHDSVNALYADGHVAPLTPGEAWGASRTEAPWFSDRYIPLRPRTP